MPSKLSLHVPLLILGLVSCLRGSTEYDDLFVGDSDVTAPPVGGGDGGSGGKSPANPRVGSGKGSSNGGTQPTTDAASPGTASGGNDPGTAAGGDPTGGTGGDPLGGTPPWADAGREASRPPIGPTNHEVTCGISPCITPMQICCVGFAAPNLPIAVCSDASGCLPLNSPLSCDSPSDCPGDQDCCADLTATLSVLTPVVFSKVACSNSCRQRSQRVICDPVTKLGCRAQEACRPSNILTGYSTCQAD